MDFIRGHADERDFVGSSKEYIKTPGVCRLSFINGIAKGLQYLHGEFIVV